jgi:predicted transcriptional regulator
MTKSETVTIRLNAELKEKLNRLAKDTRRSKSFLASEAVTRYVESEAEIVAGIHDGLKDVEAGRVQSHEDVMAKSQAIIDHAVANHKKSA